MFLCIELTMHVHFQYADVNLTCLDLAESHSDAVILVPFFSSRGNANILCNRFQLSY